MKRLKTKPKAIENGGGFASKGRDWGSAGDVGPLRDAWFLLFG